MATTFLPPTYRDADVRGMFLLGRDRKFLAQGLLGSFRAGLDTLDVHGIPDDLHQELADLDFAYDYGLKRPIDRLAAWEKVSRTVHRYTLDRGLEITGDFDAVVRMWQKLTTDRTAIEHSITALPESVETMARATATCGMVGSFATPVAAADRASMLPLMRALRIANATVAKAMCLADVVRVGSSSVDTRDHLNACMMMLAEPDMDKFALTNTGLGKFCPKIRWFHVGPFLLAEWDGVMYTFGKNSRSFLADVLWRSGMHVIHGMGWRSSDDRSDGYGFSVTGLRYVQQSVSKRVSNGKSVETLARQMKTCYAAMVALAELDKASEDEKGIAQAQVDVILEEARGQCEGEELWFDYVEGWPTDAMIDLGTAWNLLPAPDSDPIILDHAVEEKYNAPRHPDRHAWADFISYSTSAISAAWLVENPDVDAEWDRDDAEELDWVKSCRAGRLMYPGDDERARVLGVMPWTKHLEGWVYTAQDVTHVFADKSKYDSRDKMADLKLEETCELLYAATRGSILSGRYSPEEVRRSWEQRKLVGDRLVFEAAKKENTKSGDKIRETQSADDITRETLTEVDINLANISKFVEGVAARASRRKMEVNIGKIMSAASNRSALFAADITGWSPNMWRDGELMFIDAMLLFFSGTGGVRASDVLSKLHVVASRQGYHRVWEAIDGSIQGFFVCGDTMMHSLIAQWAFRNCKAKGDIAVGTKMAKVALIDDILMALENLNIGALAMARSMAEEYARLGFALDLVKSLISRIKGHFLNRLYAHDREIITASKIFARSDREWERQWIGIHDEVDSVFGSMSGAMDRGADQPHCYLVAVWRSLWRMALSNSKFLNDGAAFACYGAWLPRCLGGMGIPSLAAWTTKESQLSMEAGLGVISTIARVVKTSDPVVAKTLVSNLSHLSALDPEARTCTATALDPFSVRIPGVVDPGEVSRRIGLAALSTMKLAPEIDSLRKAASNESLCNAICHVLRDCRYPAAVVAEWASALPNAVGTAFLDKFIESEKLVLRVRARRRQGFRRDLRSLNKQAVRQYKSMMAVMVGNDTAGLSGSTVALALREASLMKSGFHLTNLESASALDAISKVPAQTHNSISVHIPAVGAGNVYDGLGGARVNLVRSSRSMPLVASATGQARALDPLSQMTEKMAAVSAYVHANGGDPAPLEQVFSQAWVNAHVDFPRPEVKGANPARLSGRLRVTSHVAACYPNTVGQISVDASRAIAFYEHVSMSFPWLSVVYALKAAAVLDVSLNATHPDGEVRHYQIRQVSVAAQSGTGIMGGPMPPQVDCCLSGDSLERAKTLMAQCLAVLGPGPDEDEEENEGVGEVAMARGDVAVTAYQILRSRGAGQILAAMRRSAYAGGVAAPTAVSSAADVRATSSEAPPTYEVIAARLLTEAASAFDAEGPQAVIDALIARRDRIIRLRPSIDAIGMSTYVSRALAGDQSAASALARHLRSHATSLGESRTEYWLSAAQRHLNEVNNRSGISSYRSLVLSSVFGSWAHSSRVGHSWQSALICTLDAFDNAINTAIRRRMAPRGEIRTRVADIAHLLLQTPGAFVRQVVRAADDSIPEDWASRDELIEAVERAATRAEMYFLSDWVGPAAMAERATSHLATGPSVSDGQDEIELPEGFDAAPVIVPETIDEDEPVNEPHPRWEEYNAATWQDIPWAEADADDISMFHDWLNEATETADV